MKLFITVESRSTEPNYHAFCEHDGRKLHATSTCSCESAAHNLASRILLFPKSTLDQRLQIKLTLVACGAYEAELPVNQVTNVNPVTPAQPIPLPKGFARKDVVDCLNELRKMAVIIQRMEDPDFKRFPDLDEMLDHLYKFGFPPDQSVPVPPNPKAPQPRQIFWISVDDHLPDDEIPVLVQESNKHIQMGIRIGKAWITYNPDGEIRGTITHWADLPEPATN